MKTKEKAPLTSKEIIEKINNLLIPSKQLYFDTKNIFIFVTNLEKICKFNEERIDCLNEIIDFFNNKSRKDTFDNELKVIRKNLQNEYKIKNYLSDLKKILEQ